MHLRDRLYIATIAEDAAKMARHYNLGIELDEFCTAVNMDGADSAHWEAVARQNMAAASRHILHAPFNELIPASCDPMIVEVARRRFEQATAIALKLGIRRLVFHTGYIPVLFYQEWFLPHSVSFWQDFIANKPADFFVYIENVLEDEPYALADLIDGINDTRVKACLDIGHAACHSQVGIAGWVQTLGARIGHVHMHNNNGIKDYHNPLNKGIIDFPGILPLIHRHAPEATFTLETTSAQSSILWLEEQNLL